jgi:hypothetical protein
MEKHLTIIVPNASGEEGLTLACKRGDLFRCDSTIESHYREGYHIHDYAVLDVDRSAQPGPRTIVQVIMKKWMA